MQCLLALLHSCWGRESLGQGGKGYCGNVVVSWWCFLVRGVFCLAISSVLAEREFIPPCVGNLAWLVCYLRE